MKKILNNAPSMNVSTQRSPLTVKLSVTAAAGRLTQAQDVMKAMWIPDRQLNALILAPLFTAYDPDLKTSASITPVITWYRRVYNNGTYTDTQITSTVTSADYYKETSGGADTGRLVVRKNVDYSAPEFIVCKAQYTDNVSSGTYTIEEEVKLTSENQPDEFYRVKIQDNSTVLYRPLKDEGSLHQLKAKVSFGDEILDHESVIGRSIGAVDLGTLTWSYASSVFTASLPSAPKTTGSAVAADYTQDQSLASNKTLSTSDGNIRIKNSSYTTAASFKAAMDGRMLFYELATKSVDKSFVDSMRLVSVFFWYCDDSLIKSDGLTPGYNGGQGTDTIALDLDCFAGNTISVRIGIPVITSNEGVYTVTLPLSPNVPARDNVLLEWEWGHVDSLAVGRGGSKIRQTTAVKVFDAIVRCDNVDVSADKVAEYICLNWKSHSTDANYATEGNHGWGTSATIPASVLKKTGNTTCEVYTDIYTLGPMGLLTDDSGSGTASQNGGYIVDDNGEYITGRV